MKQNFLNASNDSTANSTTTRRTMPPLIQLSPATLLAIRGTLLTRTDLDTVFALRDAGYVGGENLYAAFADYLAEEVQLDPQELGVDEFFRYAGDFFTLCGWGATTLSAQEDTFCVITIEDCWEASPQHQPAPKGCHLTLGLLGAFLGKFAEYPVSILEIEGPETGSVRCKFLAGNTEMIADYYSRNS